MPIVISPEAQGGMVVAVILAVQLAHWLLTKAWPDAADAAEPFLVVGWSIALSTAWFLSSSHQFGWDDLYPMIVLNLILMAAAAGAFGFVRAEVQNAGLALGSRGVRSPEPELREPVG